MTAILQGLIAQDEGLKDALEIVTTLKELNAGILEIHSAERSGRVAITRGRFVTGALTNGGDRGKVALRKLLCLRAGRFTFEDAKEMPPMPELGQSLIIDLNLLLSYIPDLAPTDVPWLYETSNRSALAVSQSDVDGGYRHSDIAIKRLGPENLAPNSIPKPDDRTNLNRFVLDNYIRATNNNDIAVETTDGSGFSQRDEQTFKMPPSLQSPRTHQNDGSSPNGSDWDASANQAATTTLSASATVAHLRSITVPNSTSDSSDNQQLQSNGHSMATMFFLVLIFMISCATTVAVGWKYFPIIDWFSSK